LRVAAGNLTLPNYSDSAAHFSGTVPGWGDRAYANGDGIIPSNIFPEI